MSFKRDKEKISPPISRRGVLKIIGAGLAITAAAAVAPKEVWASISASLPPMETWTPATFRASLGQIFSVNGGKASNLSLALVQVQPSKALIQRGPQGVVDGPADACFCLVFRGPSAPVLPQSTYTFHYSLLGSFDLFITPGKATPQGQQYTAVINHVSAGG